MQGRILNIEKEIYRHVYIDTMTNPSQRRLPL
jgi:hypothetical protein